MVPHRRSRSAGGRAAGHRAGRRRARHAVPRPGAPPGMEGPAAQGARRCGLRLEGRPGARGDPQRDRQPGGDGPALRDRRHLLRHPPRALSGRHRGRAPGPRGEFSGAAGAHRDHQAMPGARRRQPEEHPCRAARAGVSRCRVRVVRRSGLRPCFLPQPPASQMPVGAAGKKRAPELFCRLAGRLSRADVVRRSRVSRGARRGFAAGPAARQGGRQVSGGISHRRQGPGPPGGASAARAAACHSGGDSEGMARIIEVKGRRVWDSRGRPTVEAEVIVGRGTTPLACGRAIAPAGASTGSGEAKSIDVPRAVQNINTRIRDALRALSVSDQAVLDRRLIELDGTPDKSRLGANAIVAVSLACAHAAAAAAKMPLWRHLAGERRVALPVPQIQIFGGGAHARGRVDVQDYMVICIGAGSFAEALEWTAQVYAAAGARLAKKGALQGVADEGGYWPAFKSNEEALAELVGAIADAGLEPGVDVSIALDLAATQLYRGGSYHFALDGRALSAEQLHAMLLRWIESYPIVSIEDPFAEHDAEAMRAFTEAAPIQVVGDDFFVTRAAKLRNAQGACNAVLLKPNQVGTVTETLACWEAARAMGYGAIVSARSGETEDVSIVHLAVGWGVPQLKVGGFSRSERMAKWNEGLRIEGALGGGRFRMGRQDRGRAPFVHLSAQQRQHLARVLRIEVAGRLVGEDQLRLPHQGARDRHPLQLAARELARQALLAPCEADRGNNSLHSLFLFHVS